MSVYSNYITESFKQPLRCFETVWTTLQTRRHLQSTWVWRWLFKIPVYCLPTFWTLYSITILLWIFCRLIFSKSLDRISSKRLIFNYEYETTNKQDLAITLFCFRKKEEQNKCLYISMLNFSTNHTYQSHYETAFPDCISIPKS